jgi:hypothetical protein
VVLAKTPVHGPPISPQDVLRLDTSPSSLRPSITGAGFNFGPGLGLGFSLILGHGDPATQGLPHGSALAAGGPGSAWAVAGQPAGQSQTSGAWLSFPSLTGGAGRLGGGPGGGGGESLASTRSLVIDSWWRAMEAEPCAGEAGALAEDGEDEGSESGAEADLEPEGEALPLQRVISGGAQRTRDPVAADEREDEAGEEPRSPCQRLV